MKRAPARLVATMDTLGRIELIHNCKWLHNAFGYRMDFATV